MILDRVRKKSENNFFIFFIFSQKMDSKKPAQKRKKSQKEIVKSRITKLDKLDKVCVSKAKFKEPVMPSCNELKQYITMEDLEPVLKDQNWLRHFIEHSNMYFVEYILDAGFLNNDEIYNVLMQSFQPMIRMRYGPKTDKWHWLSIVTIPSYCNWSCLLQFPQIVTGFLVIYKHTFQSHTLNYISHSPIWRELEQTCFQRYRSEKLKEHTQSQNKIEYAMRTAKFHLQYKLPISMGFYISKIKSGNTIIVKLPMDDQKKVVYKLDKLEQTNWFSFTKPAWTSDDIIPVMTIDARAQQIIKIFMKKTHGIFYDFFRDILLFANLCDLKCEPNYSRMKSAIAVDWTCKIASYLLKCNTNQALFDYKHWEKLRDKQFS
jgi:hypothetical protein